MFVHACLYSKHLGGRDRRFRIPSPVTKQVFLGKSITTEERVLKEGTKEICIVYSIFSPVMASWSSEHL